jgi:predicted lactoylglutathione lyase
MINYITLGTNDLERAAKFYDELLGLVGAKRAMANERSVGWVGPKGAPMLMIMKPFDGQQATAGNGTMVALTADSPEQVAALHAKALALGGTDEGAPGPRGEGAFHCGYFRDLDGNKWNAFYMKR